jgi:bifunctional DNase/RNase
MLEMKVRGLTLDPLTNMALVILRDLEGNKALPIWVGIPEANAIALELEQVPTPRPLTHDLVLNVMDAVHVDLVRLEVTELSDGTFYANLVVRDEEYPDTRTIDDLDARPAVRAGPLVGLDVHTTRLAGASFHVNGNPGCVRTTAAELSEREWVTAVRYHAVLGADVLAVALEQLGIALRTLRPRGASGHARWVAPGPQKSSRDYRLHQTA